MIKVLNSFKADQSWANLAIIPKEKLTCTECEGDIWYISPHHLQCQGCFVVHEIEEEEE